MKNTKFVRLVSFAIVVFMLATSLAGCFPVTTPNNNGVIEDENGNKFVGVDPDDIITGDSSYEELKNPSPRGEYNKGVVLLKSENAPDAEILKVNGIVSAEPLYDGSLWYLAELEDESKTEEAVAALIELDSFLAVDYDYVMDIGNYTASTDVSCNPDYDKHHHHHPHKIPEGWDYMNKHDKNPGGSADVVIAVIDTGVDYNHLDLRNNIWVNSAEIPGNGIDDDGNGYVDDINGWNCVGDNNNPMDDNGHGTHVAGIIAAENNEIGSVGVAYNCKIMVLKAGNSSGYFNNSDIAEAVQYAYMNGASVINMSFGGSMISVAVEDALIDAYNSTILVAAAGNDGLCNQPGCPVHLDATPSYPAALPYVIGVMSTDSTGEASGFSNFDHYPYNNIEYEVYAVGESVPSTWPGNKYATLQGTSMATPMVAGIAALLRSYYTDREVYSSKFIQSQIVNTGTITPDGTHTLTNIYEALTQLPKPEVNLYDYYIDDSTSINAANNGNGVADAGETIRLYVSLHNRGGVATNVKVSADVIRNNDSNMVDPYLTFVNSEITLSDIGTYSVRESGDKYFEIKISADCPNDYLTDINIQFSYENGMDNEDTEIYSGSGKAQFNVSRGYHLSGTIGEDTVFTADRLYIVSDDVVIPEGVTVTFEEGCEIQFYADKEYYSSPIVKVFGTLNLNGTKDNTIKMHPSDKYEHFGYQIINYGTIIFNYADLVNLRMGDFDQDAVYGNEVETAKSSVNNSYWRWNAHREYGGEAVYFYLQGYLNLIQNAELATDFIDSIDSCYLESTLHALNIRTHTITNSFINLDPSRYADLYFGHFENNIVLAYYKYVNTSSGNRKLHFSNNIIKNNLFLFVNETNSIRLPALDFSENNDFSNNLFSEIYQQYASQVIDGYYDSTGNPTVDVYGSLADPSLLYPYVMNVELFNKDGELVNTIGKEEIKVRVTFNRPMDTTQNTTVTFGTVEPYADYKIEGEYVSDTVWEGTYTLKAQIENGQNYLKVNNACAAEDQTMQVHGELMLHEFTIDTTAALSMNLFAEPKENGIELRWNQDDYDTLMGYNIYRSEAKDGQYVKINPTILLPTDEYFLDENAEPGKTYWYTFTVVLSDFTESAPAGRVMATALDTMSPNAYHTPVNQGYLNNNLVISCTASDNVGITGVTLYYRVAGEGTWKSLSMSRVNDKFSATVFGSELSLAGLEYYIIATDGRNTINKGSAEAPYTVVIKDASSISRIGDVDGDNVITTKDALMIMQAINGDLILTDDEFKRADLNGDGVLSSVEALRILQYINGNVNTLEM